MEPRVMTAEEDMAYCGIVCKECPALIATRDDDAAKLAECAAAWGTTRSPLTAEDCRCDGCRDGGARFYKLSRDCAVRACAAFRGVPNCARCSDYACGKLKKLWSIIGADKPRLTLDDIRRGML